MKHFRIFLIVSSVILLSGYAKSQTGSVVLIPPSGPSVNYASITAAYMAIPSSLPTGNNYIIELLPAYNGTDASEIYPIQLTSKNLPPGGSTITIRPAAGNTGEVIKRPVPAAANLIEINGGTNIILDGRPGGITSAPADYLTLVDLFPTQTIIKYSNVRLINGASNNTIQYINSVAPQFNTGFGNRIISITQSPSGQPNNNNIIAFNTISGGDRGIEIAGTIELNTGNLVSNNIVKDFAGHGIFTGLLQDNTTIQNNTVTLSSTVNTFGLTGIIYQGGITIANITNNTVTANILPTSTLQALNGIQLSSGSGAAVNVVNNTVVNLTAPAATIINGISTQVTGNFTITNNTIRNLYSPVATSILGISGSQAVAGSSVIISQNKISELKSDANVSIVGVTASTAAGNCNFNINNNFISITDLNTNASLIYGIHTVLIGSSPLPYSHNIFFNSIRIGGNQTGGTPGDKKAACIYKSDNFTGIIYKQKNNICIMERTGLAPGIIIAGFILNDITGTHDINYNIYYGGGASNNSYAAYWLTNSYTNEQETSYKLAVSPYEQNSFFSSVIFQSLSDLHLAGASQTDPRLNGVAIAGINTDIDNDVRKIEIPTMGADENLLPNPITNLRAGNWSDPTIWSTNAVPLPSEDVFLKFDIVIDINGVCRSLTTRGRNITVNPGVTLTIAN